MRKGKTLEGRLRYLLKLWGIRRSEYDNECCNQNKTGRTDRVAARRYEGISTGTRWCLEDLKKLLEEEK